MRPTAVVMNMFYTGLGIARSLGEHGIPVIGLSAEPGIYGNFTRYAKVVRCPDSRRQPEALFDYLLQMGKSAGQRNIIFPTRDDDVVFLDRFRRELQEFYILAVPESVVLDACLDKWKTYQWALRADVPTPNCWLIEDARDLERLRSELKFPCVLKAVAAHEWRRGNNWHLVGGRKAVGVSSWQELISEYAAISRAGKRVLLQEMVAGGDECLLIAACLLDGQSNWVAGFNTQKLVQVPEGFGTGCIVQGVDRPELFEPTARLLKAMGYTGIAEVEYKWNAVRQQYQLIEINPRPWDQHRLGKACGVDLIYLAYCEYAGLPRPGPSKPATGHKWIAEDSLLMAALQLFWHRDPRLRSLLHLARGKRIYAIWSATDPLPLLGFAVTRFLPGLAGTGARAMWSAIQKRIPGREDRKKGLAYE